MSELLPCPFCGGEASAAGRTYHSAKHEAWWSDGTRIATSCHVNCIKCGADNRGLLGHQTPQDAIAAWNTRSGAALEPVTVQEAARVLLDAAKNDGDVWRVYVNAMTPVLRGNRDADCWITVSETRAAMEAGLQAIADGDDT